MQGCLQNRRFLLEKVVLVPICIHLITSHFRPRQVSVVVIVAMSHRLRRSPLPRRCRRRCCRRRRRRRRRRHRHRRRRRHRLRRCCQSQPFLF